MELLVKNFLRPLAMISSGRGDGAGSGRGDGDGRGYGYGDGRGDGYGYGYGSGYGDGYGSGSGDGYGSGYGDGSGDGRGLGIKSINSEKVYKIDDTQTIFESVKGDIAKGYILRKDLTLKPCFIVRNEYAYSHGKTLKEANKSLEDKSIQLIPIENRIEMFKSKFNDYNNKYKAKDLYDWHFRLTGSCRFGRDNFLQEHGIDINNDKLTVNKFIELTMNEYNGNIIKMLLD